MYSKKIYVKNIRNQKEKTVDFTEGVNVLYGENAVGKTTIVECVYITSILKSFKTPFLSEVINKNKKEGYIRNYIKKENEDSQIDIHIDRYKGKRLIVNKEVIKKESDHIGFFNAVFFAPEEIKIIKGSPSERRKYLDICISQVNQKYLRDLIEYNNILEKRNKSIKIFKEKKDKKDIINIWNKDLAEKASEIIFERNKFINRIKPYVNEAQQIITNNEEKLTLYYSTQIKVQDKKEMANDILKAYEENQRKDIQKGYTTYGPHRDELNILINGKTDTKKYASQGQQRTATLALKKGQCDFLKETSKLSPVLILDDIFSELDEKRSLNAIKCNNVRQIIITTNKLIKGIDANFIKIE